MAGKFRSIVMFVAIVGIFCFALNIAGISSPLYACDSCAYKTKGCDPGKGSHPCASDTKQCYHGKRCDHSYCGEHSHCNKGGSHKINEMLDLTRCAKKELLKEKLKANLEKKVGAKLDKVADLLVDAMLEEYKASKTVKGRRAALEADIREVFVGKSEETEEIEE